MLLPFQLRRKSVLLYCAGRIVFTSPSHLRIVELEFICTRFMHKEYGNMQGVYRGRASARGCNDTRGEVARLFRCYWLVEENPIVYFVACQRRIVRRVWLHYTLFHIGTFRLVCEISASVSAQSPSTVRYSHMPCSCSPSLEHLVDLAILRRHW
jgi:hypothetical protein